MTNNDKIIELKKLALDYADWEISRQFAQFCRSRKVKMTEANYNIFLSEDSIDLEQAQKIFKIKRTK